MNCNVIERGPFQYMNRVTEEGMNFKQDIFKYMISVYVLCGKINPLSYNTLEM
jgi:hypothetical protein